MRELTLDEMDRVGGGNGINPPTNRPPPYDSPPPWPTAQAGLWGDVVNLVKEGKIFTAATTVATSLPILAGEAADEAVKLAAQVAPSQGGYVCAKVGDCSGLVPRK